MLVYAGSSLGYFLLSYSSTITMLILSRIPNGMKDISGSIFFLWPRTSLLIVMLSDFLYDFPAANMGAIHVG